MKFLKVFVLLLLTSNVSKAECIDRIVSFRATQRGDLKTAECFHKHKLYSESLPLLTKLAENDSAALEYLLANLPSGYESVVESFLSRIKPKSLSSKTQGDFIYWRALGLNRKEKYSEVLSFTKDFPAKHAKYNEILYFRGVAYLNAKNHKEAERLFLQAQERLSKLKVKNSKEQLLTDVVSSTLGKMYLTKKDYKKAEEQYKKISPQSPIWYENLMELGWNQLASKNYSETLGNMYFVDQNTNRAAWKPDTYIIRSIAFLNLCYFSDANDALKIIETFYKKLYEESIVAHRKKPNYYNLLVQSIGSKLDTYVGGVPVPLLRYAAIDIDFIHVQESINNLIDEIESQKNLENQIVKTVSKHEDYRISNIDRIAKLKSDIANLKGKKRAEKQLAKKTAELAEAQKEYEGLKSSITSLSKGVNWQVEKLASKVKSLQNLQSKLEVNAAQILNVKVDNALASLKEKLDQAELIRFEIYSRSGNNIRFRLAGGKIEDKESKETAFKAFGSKELKWDYIGEIWKDEYGSLNSAVKDQCDSLNKAARKE
ncbi:MAG: hypothetical protein M9899_00685 [Bdellovibrionaceae bacterium]|nr:hypothetical protein [Pseudobdellovibrionaceae bacterium]